MLNSLVEWQKHFRVFFSYKKGGAKTLLLLKSISRVNLFVKTARTQRVFSLMKKKIKSDKEKLHIGANKDLSKMNIILVDMSIIFYICIAHKY